MRSGCYADVRAVGQGTALCGRVLASYARMFRTLRILQLRAKQHAQPEYNCGIISIKAKPSCEPLGLVPFRSSVPFLWSTTERTRLDRFSVRDQNGTMNSMANIPRAATGSPARSGSGRSDASLCAPPTGARRHWDVTRTEIVGVPVHALRTAEPSQAAAAVLELIGGTAKDVVLTTFVNPGVVPLARRSAAFRQSLHEFDYVLPDGTGMCLAVKWLHGLKAERISFDTTSLAPAVFSWSCSRGLRIVLVGGMPRVADTARAKITEAFPAIRIAGCFDGFGSIEAKARAVRELDPDVVICGMGSGRQESFLLELKSQGWRGWGFTCGGYLDQLSRGMTYYPRWVDASNLRWAYRLAREPGRLWRRYLIDYSHFVLLVFAARVTRRKYAYA